MMRNWLFFLELVVLANVIFCQEPLQPSSSIGAPAVKKPWMVTVERKTSSDSGRSSEVICAGVIVHPKLIYIAGSCVKNLEASDLKIVVDRPRGKFGRGKVAYAVTKIIRDNNADGVTHALLVFTGAIENTEVVSLATANRLPSYQDCIASEPPKQKFDGRGVQIAGKVEFKKITLGCPDVRSIQRSDFSSVRIEASCTCGFLDLCEMDYGSPLLCPALFGNPHEYFLFGYVGWLNSPSDYEYNVDGGLLTNWINTEIQRLDRR